MPCSIKEKKHMIKIHNSQAFELTDEDVLPLVGDSIPEKYMNIRPSHGVIHGGRYITNYNDLRTLLTHVRKMKARYPEHAFPTRREIIDDLEEDVLLSMDDMDHYIRTGKNRELEY